MANIQNPITIPAAPAGPIHHHMYTHGNDIVNVGDPITQQEYNDAQAAITTFRQLGGAARAAGIHQYIIDEEIVRTWQEHERLVNERDTLLNINNVVTQLIAAAAAAPVAQAQQQGQAPGPQLAQLKVPQP